MDERALTPRARRLELEAIRSPRSRNIYGRLGPTKDSFAAEANGGGREITYSSMEKYDGGYMPSYRAHRPDQLGI